MKILKARHLGMCFGVRDAIALALKHSGEGVTVLGDLVHNPAVLRVLRDRGVAIERDLASVNTANVMITAHGASEARKSRVMASGKTLIEATCPLVAYAHRSIAGLALKGYHPVIIGKRGHVEVTGLTEDLEACDIILTEEDVNALPERSRFGVAAQTTQPLDRVHHLVACLRRRFPKSEVHFVDTVCQPTKQRQQAAIDLARSCSVVVVVGGANSNNTSELAATCARHCRRVHKIETAAELHHEWFEPEDTVGITAGTSTPDWVIDAVESRLHSFSNQTQHQPHLP